MSTRGSVRLSVCPYVRMSVTIPEKKRRKPLKTAYYHCDCIQNHYGRVYLPARACFTDINDNFLDHVLFQMIWPISSALNWATAVGTQLWCLQQAIRFMTTTIVSLITLIRLNRILLEQLESKQLYSMKFTNNSSYNLHLFFYKNTLFFAKPGCSYFLKDFSLIYSYRCS